MEQLRNLGDERNTGFCVHCGGLAETRDHAPSRIFLDDPLPDELSVSPSCYECNNSLSTHEEYLACVLECVLAGEVDLQKITRPKVVSALRHSPSLVKRLKQQRQSGESGVTWAVEIGRVERVVLKLARSHLAFESGEPRIDPPANLIVRPLQSMEIPELEHFELGETECLVGWPGVGSRAMQRMLGTDEQFYPAGWINVQDGNYRYKVDWSGRAKVQIVLREYLACDIVWK